MTLWDMVSVVVSVLACLLAYRAGILPLAMVLVIPTLSALGWSEYRRRNFKKWVKQDREKTAREWREMDVNEGVIDTMLKRPIP